jgi:hypothetical protein
MVVETMNESVAVIIGHRCPSEDPGKGILNTPICVVDAGLSAEE